MSPKSSPKTKVASKKKVEVSEEESSVRQSPRKVTEDSEKRKRRGQKTFNTEISNLFGDINKNDHDKRYSLTSGSRQTMNNIAEYVTFTVAQRVVQLRSGSMTKAAGFKTVKKNNADVKVTIKKNPPILQRRMIEAAILSLFPAEYFNKIDAAANKVLEDYANSDERAFTAKTGLHFTSAHIGKILRKNVSFEKISALAIVYAVGAIEFVISGIIEDALNNAAADLKEGQNCRVKSSYFSRSITGNANLRMVFCGCIFAEGVTPMHQKNALERIGLDQRKIDTMFPEPKPKVEKAAKSPKSPKSPKKARKARVPKAKAATPKKKAAAKKPAAKKPAAKKPAAAKKGVKKAATKKAVKK